MTLKLTSNDIKDGQRLPDAQVRAKANLSPQLAWSGAPQGTKSFAITVFDPDAPRQPGFWHWAVANIPADVTSLPTGAGSGRHTLPKGAVQGMSDFGKPGFGGAAPPPGPPHHYRFTVFALDTDKVDVSEADDGAAIEASLRGHMLDKASITATYGV